MSDVHRGHGRAVLEVFPRAGWQRRLARLMCSAGVKMRTKEAQKKASAASSAVLKESGPALAGAAYGFAAEKAGAMSKQAGMLLEDAREDALRCLSFSRDHRLQIGADDVQERARRETKRRTNVVQVLPSRKPSMCLLCAVLADQKGAWLDGRFMDAAGMTSSDRGAEHPARTEETLQIVEALIAKALRTAA